MTLGKLRRRIASWLVTLACKITTQDHEGWEVMFDANTKWVDKINEENAKWQRESGV